MKRIVFLLILLLVSPANAHRRYIKYVTADTTDATTGSGNFTSIVELGMPALVSQALVARCYIVTTSSAQDVGVLLGFTGPIGGSPVITGVIEPEWPELEITQITNIERGGVDGTCAAGVTCVTNPTTPLRNGDYVRILNAGDMSQIVGMVGQVTYDPGFPNYFEIGIDSSLFSPWDGLGATILRLPPGKQYITNANWPYVPNPAIAPTSLGSTRVLTDIRMLIVNGTVGAANISDINRGGTGDTPSCTAGLTCIVATAHGFNTGDYVQFWGINGTAELNNTVNKITKIDANNFTIAVNSSAYGAFTTAGGTAQILAMPTFNPATAGTATVNKGSWCEYTYEVGN